MAYNATTGKWEYEDDTISSRLPGLLSAQNPLMTQARTSAMQFANKRGLLNSSMAAQAGEEAALKTVIPVASQESQQTYGKNIQEMQARAQKDIVGTQTTAQKDIAGMNVAAHDRQYLANLTSEFEKKYGAMLTEVVKNNELTAGARNTYYQHFSALRDSDMSLAEQIYGVDLQWTSATAAHTP